MKPLVVNVIHEDVGNSPGIDFEACGGDCAPLVQVVETIAVQMMARPRPAAGLPMLHTKAPFLTQI